MKLILWFYLFLFSIINPINAQHISEFVSLAGGSQSTDFVQPSEHTFQYIIEAGDAYTSGGGTLAPKFDFTGYVPSQANSNIEP